MDRRSWLAFGAVLLLVAATSGFLRHHQAGQRLGAPGVKLIAEPTLSESGEVIATNSVALPERVLDYASETMKVPKVVHDWLPKDTTYGHRFYTARDGFIVDAQVVLMGADRTSLHQPQYCLTGSGWQIDASEAAAVRMARPHTYDLPVTKLTLTGWFQTERGPETRRGVFVYWFVADGELTADHRQRMWSLAREQLRTGILQRWAYVICFAACAPGAEEATFGRLKEFIAAATPEFQLAAGPPLAEKN
ncbi:MAG: exosortase-associated EpsI family protein [Verrucomicrobia bacterium]|nr:exosortase-associated EpsI family protein [Verrucomicrobiota bacterium]